MRLKYVNTFRDRHGGIRHYFRRAGQSVALPGEPGSAEFMEAYHAALASVAPRKRSPAPDARSFDALARHYYRSPDFIRLKPGTQRAYRSTLKTFLNKYGRRSVLTIRFEHVSAIIGKMADTPAAANNTLKRLRQLFALARRLDWIDRDPSEGVKYFRTGEIHTWTADEHASFVKHWPAGSMPRLAYMAHTHTGQRRSDVVRLPMPKASSEPFRIMEAKKSIDTDRQTPNRLEIPLSPALWEEIQRHERRPMLLVTSFGNPFTPDGYGNWFREKCDEAGLPKRCTSHGLRKSTAKDLAEAGCSAHEIQAITGHKSLKEVERYTRAAEQQRLAKSALAKRNKSGPSEG